MLLLVNHRYTYFWRVRPFHFFCFWASQRVSSASRFIIDYINVWSLASPRKTHKIHIIRNVKVSNMRADYTTKQFHVWGFWWNWQPHNWRTKQQRFIQIEHFTKPSDFTGFKGRPLECELFTKASKPINAARMSPKTRTRVRMSAPPVPSTRGQCVFWMDFWLEAWNKVWFAQAEDIFNFSTTKYVSTYPTYEDYKLQRLLGDVKHASRWAAKLIYLCFILALLWAILTQTFQLAELSVFVEVRSSV